MAQNVNDAAAVKKFITTKQFLRAGQAFFETALLNQLYALRQYEPIWINGGQVSPFAAALKNMIATLSFKHGLVASDYWTAEHDAYMSGLNEKNALAFEFISTRAFIAFSHSLANGQIDPTFLDNDIRFKRRSFTDFNVLMQAVSATPGVMSDIVETLAPQHIYYRDALDILAQLNRIQAQGGFKSIKKPSVEIKLGDHHSAVPVIRQRVNQHGYTLAGTGDVYDQELSQAVQEIQRENAYLVNQNLKPDSGFWTIMRVSVEERLQQAKAQLEKLRWLPKNLESRMIFVNTNSTEVKIFEDSQVIQKFKTINGRVLRRTPMMRAWIAQVILNPKWTATDSIVIQDKLPKIQEDNLYFKKIRMRVFNRQTGVELDPTTVDWVKNGRALVAENRFVMDPGPSNALGVYKFPLTPDPQDPKGTNADDIYLHFTDDPSLFAKATPRLLSSGCVRLERAQWLAEYLLKNVSGYDAASISQLVAKGTPGETFQTNLSVLLPSQEIMPVYAIPLTIEKTASGKPRFMKDFYLQDRRILDSIFSQSLRQDSFQKAIISAAPVQTGLRVLGEPGFSQQFSKPVAIRCDEPTFTTNPKSNMRVIQRHCDKPLQFELNKDQELPPGKYMVAFENTIYPGFVEVRAGAVASVELQKIQIPEAFAKETQIKIFRDFSSLIEQRKVYFEKFYFGRNIFRQVVRQFGDYYIAGLGDIDWASSKDLVYCSENEIDKLQLASDIREHAKFVCESFNQAEGMMDYADLYRFASNGTYQEAFADYPGDVMPKRFLRTLVATPASAKEFVSVMPGVYRLANSNGKLDQRVVTSNLVENYSNLKRTFANSQTGVDDDSDLDVQAQIAQQKQGQDVESLTCNEKASLWRTERRTYCTSDSSDGCNKTEASMCQEMTLDLRFRK